VVAVAMALMIACTSGGSESTYDRLRAEVAAIESSQSEHSGDPSWSDIVDVHSQLDRRSEDRASIASLGC
jgi:hypothetical protein